MVFLSTSNLKKAISALENSLNITRSNQANSDKDLKDTLRAGVIQNFEVAYEQCWKMIQRFLRENKTPEEADFPRTRKELFRLAARYSLINDPIPWFEYGDARNQTSHTYDNDSADYVYQVAEKFIFDAKNLLAQFELLADVSR